MFGPLNGVRVALVAGAGLAAVVAFFIGETWVGLVLVAGIAVHGLGWLYLYREHRDRNWPERSSDHPLGESGRHNSSSLP